MDKYEVTNDKMVSVLQWAYDHGRVAVSAVAVSNLQGEAQVLLTLSSEDCRITWGGGSFGMREERSSGHPCIMVTWYGAAAYCNYRSEMEGRTPCYSLSNWSCNFSANGYRLPTSEEWEYAARGGAVGKRFPWGDTISHSQVNYEPSDLSDYDLSGGFHPAYVGDSGDPYYDGAYISPVGSFAANAYGLYDMAGNIAEWCNDWHPCQIGVRRVVRGGALLQGTAGTVVTRTSAHHKANSISSCASTHDLSAG